MLGLEWWGKEGEGGSVCVVCGVSVGGCIDRWMEGGFGLHNRTQRVCASAFTGPSHPPIPPHTHTRTHTTSHSFRFSLELMEDDPATAEAADQGAVVLRKRFRVRCVASVSLCVYGWL